ncbi:MAG: glycosyltransferase family 2 protein [Bacteroidetes bacterium]|nr:glycosyltransferase family 2 protein [Bacteroidota bacterium]
MEKKIPVISVVSPVYRAEKTLDELVKQIKEEMKRMNVSYEIILVDDCGPDKSWEEIENICANDITVKGIKLSRNFGQHYAITAGLDKAKGEWIVVMDCDLQDRSDQIHKFYDEALKGYDVVQGRRENRKDSFFKRTFSWLFYKVLAYLSGYSQDNTIANFGIYHRKVVAAIISMREVIRFFPTMVAWVGFKKTSIEIEHAERSEGKSSYTFSKLLNLALDIILAYSDKPLRIMIKLGLLTSFVAFVYLVFNLYKYLSGQIIVMGYTSLIVSIWFLCGLIMLMLGVVGLYIGKTFESTKQRPIYIIDKMINE